jgi:hypothetical protein
MKRSRFDEEQIISVVQRHILTPRRQSFQWLGAPIGVGTPRLITETIAGCYLAV